MQDEPRRDFSEERWWRIRQLAEQVMASTDTDVERALQEACGDDPDLIEEVRKLLDVADTYDDMSVEMAGEHTPKQGARLGPYRLLRKIGEGGFGEVWMAQQVELVERFVAIKLIKPGMDSSQVIARFEAERQALAMMDHPNIASVLDVGSTEQERPYFVMELVRGVRITEYVRTADLDLASRIELMQQVCNAVQHAHQKGVIHRDLKPGNVLVTEIDGKPIPKVIDFGVAKALERPLTDKTLFTEFRQFLGTPEYMSPEQASLSMMDVDTRSDVYSLGVLLYELLVGAPPFDPESLRSAGFDEMRRIIREEEPPAPSDRLSRDRTTTTTESEAGVVRADRRSRQVRGELDWIVQRAMAKERDRRYSSANDLSDDLGRYLTGEPVVAGPVSSFYRARRFVHRNRTGVAVAAMLLVVVLGFIGMLIWDNVRIQSARRETERALKLVEEARNSTEKQKEIAEARNEFLDKLLTSSVPSVEEGMGIDASLRGLLEVAVKELDKGPFKHPETEAAMRKVIGEAYMAHGEDDLALPQLQRALEISVEILGEGHVASLECAAAVIYAHMKRHDWEKAEARIRVQISYLTDLYGADSIKVLREREGLAICLKNTNQFEEAEAIYLATLRTCQATLGGDHAATVNTVDNLAKLYLGWGRNEEALRYARLGLKGRTHAHGENSPQALMSLRTLAACLSSMGEYKEADALLVEMIEGSVKTFGPTHPATLLGRSDRVSILIQTHKWDEATVACEELVAICITANWEDRHSTQVAQLELATCYQETGRLDDAEALTKQVVDRALVSHGEDSPNVISGWGVLARIYKDQDRLDESLAMSSKVLEAQERRLGPTHPLTLVTMFDIAQVHRARGDLVLARKLMQQTLALQREHAPTDPRLAAGMNILAAVELDLGELASAKVHGEDSLRLTRSIFDTPSMQVAQAQNVLIKTLMELGELEEADALCQENCTIWEQVKGADHKKTLAAKQLLFQIKSERSNQEPAKLWDQNDTIVTEPVGSLEE